MSDEIAQQQRRLRLKKSLAELSGMKGMGTELVTVIIPPDRMISDVRQTLEMRLDRRPTSSQNPRRSMLLTP